MIPEKSLVIAVDFDGTILESAYPKISPLSLLSIRLKHLKMMAAALFYGPIAAENYYKRL